MARCTTALIWSGHEVEWAESLADEAICLDQNCFDAWMWGGWAKLFLGDHRTAIDYFQRALRLSPLDPRIFYVQDGLAFAYFHLGKYEEGLKYAVAACHIQPNHAGSFRIAMACNALSGNIEAAQKLWLQVALLSPSDRVSETRKRSPLRREEDLRKLEQAYRLAGMPE
jgi:tetratricopeptide (TPR) repeat protein